MYTGYTELQLTDTQLNQLYTTHQLSELCLYNNQYLIVKDAAGAVIDYFKYQDNSFHKVKFPELNSEFTGRYKPRNPQQYCAFDLLKDRTTTIKLLTGSFGTGKTLALIAAALEAIERGDFDKIVWVRNNVQVRDTDAIGALPGTEYDKLLPYAAPFMDHVGGELGLKTLISEEKLQIVPLGFIRGRSIRNSIIISSEAENLTKQHIQLLMGRVDEGSNLWLDADLKQRDRDIFEKSKGIETMIDRLKDEKLFGYVHLVKSERSETARLADKLD